MSSSFENFIAQFRAEASVPTQETANALSEVAKRTVVIAIKGGDTFTGATAFQEGEPIRLELDPVELKNARTMSQAFKVWRGLAAQQLALQLYPAGAQYAAAKQEGFAHIFHVLNQEHNQRIFAAAAPAQVAELQALTAYSYRVESLRATSVQCGAGGVDLGEPEGYVATAAYAERFNDFAVAFRRGNAARGEIARSCVVPENFKELSKDEVLALARTIHGKFCEGIELTAQQQAAAKAAKPDGQPQAPRLKLVKNDAPATAPGPQGPEGDEEPPAERSTWWAKLLANKWTAGTVGVFGLGWTYVLLKFGHNFWTLVACMAVLALAVGGTAIWFFRSAIGRALGNGLAAVARTIGRALEHPATKYVVMTLAGALVCLLLAMLFLKVPLAFLGVGFSAIGILIFMSIGLSSSLKKDEESGSATKVAGGALALSAIVFAVSAWYAMLALGYSPWLVAASLFMVVGSLLCMALMMVIPVGEGSGNQQKDWGIFNLLLFPVYIGYAIANGIYGICRGIVGGAKAFSNGAKATWNGFVRMCKAVGRFIVFCAKHVWGALRDAAWFAEPLVVRLWAFTLTRMIILALPFGIVITAIISVLQSAGEVSYLLLGMLVVLLLAGLGLVFWFRKQLWSFVANQGYEPVSELIGSSDHVPMDKRTTDFKFLRTVHGLTVEVDPAVLAELMPIVNTLSPRLRKKLENLGVKPRSKDELFDGDEIGDHPEKVLEGELDIYEGEHTVPVPSIFFGAGFDCSDSMKLTTARFTTAGDKFRHAIIIGLVLEEAFRGLPFMTYERYGFDDTNLYDCNGSDHLLTGLKPRGGNNDAGMFSHLRHRALMSTAQIRILALMSDVQPSDSTWGALRNEVVRADNDGFFPWQFLFDTTQDPAIEKLVTDCHQLSLEEAVDAIGDTIVALVEENS